MAKVTLETDALMVPVPVVLLSVSSEDGGMNITTVAWVSVACAVPPMVSVAMRPERLSHSLIRESGEFVLNIPSAKLLRAVDVCGVVSGRDIDKFARTGLTPLPSLKVAAPGIAECPVNLECVLRQSIVLGSHVLLLSEVVALRADEEVVEDGGILTGRIGPLAYDPFGGDYWTLKEVVAHHGFSEGTMPDPVPRKTVRQQRKKV